MKSFFVALFFAAFALNGGVVHADIASTMTATWGGFLATIYQDQLQLQLNQYSGSGAESNNEFLFGSTEMLIKLVPRNSAGTVTAYYLSSLGETHDEIDFEFLGNVTGQPYKIHTNVFVQGVGNKEQQFFPWFDPTTDYHNYTIHWNPSVIVWYVDSIPIRVYRNYASNGIGYPNARGMRLYTSLWEADDWATRGGLDKIDWSNAPFTAGFQNFRPRSCIWNGPVSISQCAALTADNWWTAVAYSQLTPDQQIQLQRVRDNYMIYDYCRDSNRFNGTVPAECFMRQY
ncbi:hypothetical protein QQ045_014505 [Rhodiola kirilowii]